MSFAPDLAWLIGRDLEKLASIERVSDGVRVTTHCLYPSNGLVRVTVRAGTETAVVSDDGAGLGEALAAGIPVRNYTNALSHLVADQGLLLKDGMIFTPMIPLDAASLAILHVANASQEVARWLYDHLHVKRSRDFRVVLAEFLKAKFEERLVRNAVIVGHSQKPHRFANVVDLPGGSKLIVDPVTHEASSINARVVANLDVKANNDHRVHQRIVYDDDESWSAADLNLLQVGAFAVPFSRSAEVIGKIASSA